MNCPHYIADGKAMRCDCLPSQLFQPLAKPHNPCAQCQPAFVNGTAPDPANRETWTPVLLTLAQRQRGERPAMTVQPAEPTPYPTNHPDHCAHQLRILDHVGCCGSRRWQCELKGEVRITDCRRCAEFDRDSPDAP